MVLQCLLGTNIFLLLRLNLKTAAYLCGAYYGTPLTWMAHNLTLKYETRVEVTKTPATTKLVLTCLLHAIGGLHIFVISWSV